jgi:hypothetical protein
MVRFALLTWFLITLFSLRWFGIWYMNRPGGGKYCHSSYRRTNLGCSWNHRSGCLRSDGAEARTTRTTGDGFKIVGLALTWPVMVWPLLALWLTPETAEEHKQRVKDLEAEVKRLEREAA